MSLNTSFTLQMIKKKLHSIRSLMDDIEEARGQSESTNDQLEIIRRETIKKEEPSSDEKEKLKNIYTSAIADAKREGHLLREALKKIDQIRSIRKKQRLEARKAGNDEPVRRGVLMKMLTDTARTLPLYSDETMDSQPPPLCGCIPAKANYVAEEGQMVAAHVRSKKIGDAWILAEILSFDKSTSSYKIEDIDVEDKATYTVHKRQVVPLPTMRTDPETNWEGLFPIGTEVLAVYPQTTCFYKAKINEYPLTAQDDYKLLFEDENGMYTVPLLVPQRYVISKPSESKKKKKPSVNRTKNVVDACQT